MKPLSEIGWTMPNGAMCLSVTWSIRRPTEGVGLFVWPESPDPFVTWSVSRQSELAEEWNCHTGHYFISLSAAIADYQARGGSTT